MSEQKPISILPSDPIARRHGDNRDTYELMLEVIGRVDALTAVVNKLHAAVNLRLHPGYLWYSLALATVLVVSVVYSTFRAPPYAASGVRDAYAYYDSGQYRPDHSIARHDPPVSAQACPRPLERGKTDVRSGAAWPSDEKNPQFTARAGGVR